MKIKVFNFNANGKVEFTKEELEILLTEVYEDGVSDGKDSNSNVITWYNSPHLGPTGPICSATLTSNDSEDTTTNHTCCSHTKDCDCNCSDTECKDNINSIECSINNLDVNAAKKMVNDVFSALAKELGL